MAPANRRSFLGGLARLPLVGGAVTLIGQPTASAEPITSDLLEGYKTWLDLELRVLCATMAEDPMFRLRYGQGQRAGRIDRVELASTIAGTLTLVGDTGRFHHSRGPSPYVRAALVLSTVGCDWRRDGR